MKKFFDENGIGAIVVGLLVILVGYYFLSGTKPPASKRPAEAGFDSSTYYKNLNQQGKLNYEFHSKIQSYESQLKELRKDLNHEKGRIDRLRGADLQREVDSEFNSGTQSRRDRSGDDSRRGRNGPAGSGSGPVGRSSGGDGRQSQTAPANRTKNDSVHRGGRTAGAPLQSRSAGEPGHDCPERLYALGPDRYDYQAERADRAAQPPAAGQQQRRSTGPGPYRRGPDQVARSAVGELAVAGRAGGVHSHEVQTHLVYWRLIRRQRYTYPDVAWAISAVETGYWWSPAELARHGHNLFGMKKNGRGFYTSVSGDGYCRYAGQLASFDDYGSYEASVIRRYGIRDQAGYVAHICKRFCPNPIYGEKLALAFQKLKRIQQLA